LGAYEIEMVGRKKYFGRIFTASLPTSREENEKIILFEGVMSSKKIG